MMIHRVSDNIISSLGISSEENYKMVKEGISGLKLITDKFNIPEPFFASLIGNEKIDDLFSAINNKKLVEYTRVEKLSIISALKAIENAALDPSSEDVLFIFSTTKGNIELLEGGQPFGKERIYLWKSAQLIRDYFNNPNPVLVISNACISGVAAQLTAINYLKTKRYKYAIVIGAEVLSKFIISGFQSFKALSPNMCKPFDKERIGLNLGEAAATIIYKFSGESTSTEGSISFVNGAVCNDANHISGPSRTGEGLYNAIQKTVQTADTGHISFINAHGTATPYNDNMESHAIERAGFSNIPTNSLKPYFGHTLGAAGILETVISFHSLSDNTILGTLGYENYGVEKLMMINRDTHTASTKGFLKLISGFGGVNAAIMFKKESLKTNL